MAQAFSRRPLTAEARVRSRVSPCGMCWTKLHWDRFFPEYLGFPLSISFHRCSITRKNEKTLIIFITRLHNKPRGCSASVVSAAGPFTNKQNNKQDVFSTPTCFDSTLYVTVHVIHNATGDIHNRSSSTLVCMANNQF
jgi:hypothetical protein